MPRKLTFLLLILVALVLGAGAADRDVTVKIMTQNMDAATDQNYIVAALLGYLPLPLAVDLTFAEIQASNLPQRAAVLADKIAAQKPDFVALQEATLWRAALPPQMVEIPIYDQLALLLAALKDAGTPYEVVKVLDVNDQTFPGGQIGSLRIIDRNVLLVRADARPSGLQVSDVRAKIFTQAFPFGGLQVYSGWIGATVSMGGQHFRLFTTHLQTPVSGVPQATGVQMVQAMELIAELGSSADPVVLCGDFNSDALHGGFVDDTPTVDLIQGAGYQEVWSQTHDQTEPGLTWPYYLEDLFPPSPFFAPQAPYERIDLFFAQGMRLLGSHLVLARTPAGTLPPYASDHAGVLALFRPSN